MRSKTSRTIGYLLSVALAVALLLAGCSRSNSPEGVASTSGNASWTTLGTRALTSQPGVSITRNAAAKWVDYNPPALYPNTVTQPIQYITMPDGTQLAAFVTLPADSSGNAIPGSFPVILDETAYNAEVDRYTGLFYSVNPYIVEHGYAIVVVDVRGTGQSTGSWDAFGSIEQSDYGHVVDWVTQQPWYNGSIGLYGTSYHAISAIITAAQNHPAVKANFSVVPIGDGYRDIVFTGGQMSDTFAPIWLGVVSALSLVDPVVLTDPSLGITAIVDHIESAITGFQVPLLLQGLTGDSSTAYDDPTPGSFWQTRSPLENDGKITVPTFIVGGLHDIFQRSEPISYEEVKTHAPAKLLIGPWTHIQATSGTAGLPADGVPVLAHIELQWFDQYVKGMDVGADRLPNVTQYVYGYNHFVTSTDWPHPQVQAQKLYLHGDKSLSFTSPATGEASNTVAQEPLNGLCSISLSQWTAGITGSIPLPCQTNDDLAEQTDVKYQTPPMTADIYINGPIEADVWMSTTASDAGLSVRVDDVDSSGSATPLTNGIQTASLRAVDTTRSRFMNGLMIQPWHPYTQSSVLTVGSGNVVMVPVEIFPTSAMIAKGHSLRIAIGASDLPQGIPPIPTLLNSLVGALTIYSDAAHPSSVVIPVVPVSALN